jgi:hypothetical protein
LQGDAMCWEFGEHYTPCLGIPSKMNGITLSFVHNMQSLPRTKVKNA